MPAVPYMSPSLRNEILEKREEAVNNPKYHLKRNNCEKKVRQAHNKYSWLMEHPQTRKEIEQGDQSAHEFADQGINRINTAWNHLNRNHHNIADKLDHSLLKDVAQRIDPNNTRYRTAHASLQMRDFAPPNAAKIPHKLDEFFYTLHNRKTNELETAIYTHLNIAGIQPFNDGNKRLARTLQMKILHDAKLPPPIVKPSERHIYMTLLEDALIGSRVKQDETDIQAVRPFFDYMGGKVNTMLDNCREHLE